MEKRLLLALTLSILVLYLWPGLNPSSRPAHEIADMSQFTGNEKVVARAKAVPPSIETTKDAPADPPEETKQLESEKIRVEFSNVGGSIKRIVLKEHDFVFPLTDVGAVSGYEASVYSVDYADENKIVYVYSDDKVKIHKSYKISDHDYTVDINTRIERNNEGFRLDNISINGFAIDMSNLDLSDIKKKESYEHDKALLEYAISSDGDVYRKNNAYKFSKKEDRKKDAAVHWIGFRSRYLCFIMKPLHKAFRYEIEHVDNNRLKIKLGHDNTDRAESNSIEFPSVVFVGPEETNLLQSYKLGFEDIKRYYRWTLFDSIAKIIYSIMYGINKLIPNWGMCIIIISIIVYFSMYPLTLRSMASMKKMQAMQPKISALREKFKDNPQKMNMEMMELYRKHSINPLGGCLPMLLQMPVFIGLYQVLWRSVSLKGADFLWINDLSAPDRLFVFSYNIPFIGNELNILPIIMIFVMAFQQKLTAKNMVVSDPAQAAQQKMMAVIMPVFLGYIFYKFSSGLTLYFTMFYMFSTLTQWKMSTSKEVVA